MIGLARLHTDADADAMLARIQNDLFDLGPTCAGRATIRAKRTRCACNRPRSSDSEDEIDRLNASLAPLESFILPGEARSGLPAPGAHGRAPGRTPDHRTGVARAGQPGRTSVPEPAFRSPVRARPPPERPGRRRRALGAGGLPVEGARALPWPPDSSSRNAFAASRSAVPKPSLNQS